MPKLPEYPTADLLHLKGGRHGVSEVVVGTAATLVLTEEKGRGTVMVHPVGAAVDLLDSDQATEGFPLLADQTVAIPTQDALYMKAAADTVVKLIVINASR